VTSPAEPHDLVELAAHLRLAIGRLHRQLRLNDGGELSPTQVACLVAIERNGPIAFGDLAALEHLAPPTITAVVAKLEHLGFVDRRKDPADGRVSLATITETGRTYLGDSRARRTAWLVDALEQLAPADLRRLAAAVDVVEKVGKPPAGTGA
jgi:DNA-binding MarR family transcriptional regulator